MPEETAQQVSNQRPRDEEMLNALTHGVGFALSVYGATQIWRVTPPPPTDRAIAWWVYASTLMAMYAVSALHHTIREPHLKHAFRVLDQGVIYLLIAGTFTPLMWAYLPRPLVWIGLAMVWVPAFAGKYLKVVGHQRIHDFSSLTYLLLGWLPALLTMGFLPRPCFGWLLLGGIFYSVGTWFLMRDRRRRFFHPIWHLFVILASACHFYTIYRWTLLEP